MIEKMTRYSIIALSGEKENILKEIQDIGLMDIKRSSKPVDETSAKMLSEIQMLRKSITCIEKDDYNRDEEYRTLCAQLSELEKELTERERWGSYDVAKMKALNKLGFKLRCYCIPVSKYDSSWENLYPLEIIDNDGKNIWFATISDAEDYSLPVPEIQAPAGPADETAEKISQVKAQIEARTKFLSLQKDDLPQLKRSLAEACDSFEKYIAGCTSEDAAEGALSVFTGFAPTSDDSTVCTALDKMEVYYMTDPATAEDNPPIKLRNNWFARNFETLTGMYGMPVYDEFDPTPVLAPFFLLFWAFCMGDAGYGLILIAIGFLLDKVNILGLRNHKRLVITLGVGATVIGLFLGTFFGVNLTEVSWIPESLKKLMLVGKLDVGGTAYDLSMAAALAIGVIHICLAMVIKAIGLTKRTGFKTSISTWGWIILIVGGIAVAALALTKVIDSSVTKIAVIAIGILSFLGIFIFNKPGRNPLLNVGAGLWDTYSMVTGILGDVLSYIRLYALGLAGGMLGAAFNDLAQMTLGSNPTWQWLPFILIVVIGHALNFAMSCLGAFVHPLRLTFVEYFKNSGYEGRGTQYKPLKKETINN